MGVTGGHGFSRAEREEKTRGFNPEGKTYFPDRVGARKN